MCQIRTIQMKYKSLRREEYLQIRNLFFKFWNKMGKENKKASITIVIGDEPELSVNTKNGHDWDTEDFETVREIGLAQRVLKRLEEAANVV